MRVVLDTNVIVAAFRSPRGASARLVNAGRLARIEALVSGALFFEYEAVLTRAEHLLAAGANANDARRFLDALALWAKPVRIAYLWRPQLSDADDEMVLECAVNGRAAALVSFETATFAVAAPRFGIEVLTPVAFWSRINS
ncbi:MAG: putative toxin-antitoxin system toxin component, PIN family [Hyphomonadaceae bacterium]|nr:putative toxin-antitoxin system toxin component, PIN family [Hyphomonadaceae bacterium]